MDSYCPFIFGVGVLVCTHAEARARPLVSSSVAVCLIDLGQDLSADPELVFMAGSAGQQALVSPSFGAGLAGM